MSEYQIGEGVPEPHEYTELRVTAGLSPMSEQAARRGLPGTLYGVTVRRGGLLVGMGRLIGDGGCFYQIVDVAVDPDHQGRGLGRRILERIIAHLEENAPPRAYVSLLADPPGRGLYEKMGFAPTAPHSVGMFRRF